MAGRSIELAGAVVVITGAARGIGRATAAQFAERGARVCLGDLDTEGVATAAAEIGRGCEPFQVDVRSRESFTEFLASIELAVGPVDILVNNAGVMPVGRFLDESDATTSTIFGVNVAGPIHGMRLVLPGMIERQRGHIVNVASMLGRTELPGLATYTASKHAVVGLTAAVRREMDGTGVTLTTVLPAVVNTELSSGITIPLARVIRVEPGDVARAVVNSVQSRPKEVTVPRWMGLYPVVRPFIPDVVESIVRKVVGDDKAFNAIDPERRAGYTERLARQAKRED